MADSAHTPAVATTAPVKSGNKKKALSIAGLVGLSVLSSFFAAWLFLATGFVKTPSSIAEKQTLVMQQGEVVSDIYKRVSPSTVSITTHTVDTSQRYLEPTVSEGAGSGIIISKDGYVMTNKHVVPDGTDKITVILADGKQFTDVKIVGRDPSNDIAFIKINGVSNLTAATLGDSSQVAPGQQVAAIGNALGLFRNSITSGIISGTGRPVQASDETGAATEQLEDMFQTDAAINPGNSGGPLVNLKGEVIGMNTAVSSEGQGIGFAIPINSAKGEINGVITKGKIVKAYLGVRYVSVDAEIAQQLDLKVNRGSLIRGNGTNSPGVLSGSPAARAGLRDGDIIIKVGEQDVTPESGLATKLAQYNPGDKVDMVVQRGNQQVNVTVTLGDFPQ